MSDVNRIRLAIIGEQSFGGDPDAGNPTILRFTGDSLKQDTATVVSEQIRSDRQIVDIIRTGRGVSGNVNFELTFETFNDLLKAMLMDDAWSSPVTISATTISASSVDNSFNDSGAGFGSLVADSWIKTAQFSNAANNGVFKIVSKTSTKIIVEGGTLVTEAAGSTRIIKMGAEIINGTTLKSFILERAYLDLSPILYAKYNGMCINQMSMDIPADGVIKGNFAFIGIQEQSTGPLSAQYTDETETAPMTGANHVYKVLENMSDLAVLSAALTLNNNLRSRLQVGTLGPIGVGTGSLEVTGSLRVYFESNTLYNKYLNQTKTSLVLIVQDSDGNVYVVDLPSVKITNGQRVAGGPNTDVVAELEFRAYMDEDEENTIRIASFPFS